MQQANFKNYFEFTKKERRGIIVLLATILSIFLSFKYLYPLIIAEESINDKELTLIADSLKITQVEPQNNYYKQSNAKNKYEQNTSYNKNDYDKPFTGTMFYFDPNTLSTEGWQKLGIRDKTIASMQKYIAKGGRFKQPEDLQKVWGLREEEKERLIPYVKIADQPEKTYTQHNYEPYEKKGYEKKAIAIIDINSADSLALDALPGIGGGFAKRILKFKERLGGFYKVEQVAETYGLPDSTYQKIKPYLKVDGNNLIKININTATEEQLKTHPYIRWQFAKLIVAYKTQHGNFKNLTDLKKIMGIDEESCNKMIPYLSL